jgi:endonuclease-3 related protein
MIRRFGAEPHDARSRHEVDRPIFPVSVATRRVLARHGLVPAAASRTAVRAFVEAHLPSDPRLFDRYQALLLATVEKYCRAVPRCAQCPLRFDLQGRPPRAT